MAQPWHGRFCWYELMTTDPKGAEGFYAKVVGWSAEPFPGGGPYTLWKKGDENVGGLMELTAEARAAGAHVGCTAYVAVEDAEATARQAASLGGRVHVPPTEIPSIGRFAILSDPAGAVLAIMQPSDPSAGRPLYPLSYGGSGEILSHYAACGIMSLRQAPGQAAPSAAFRSCGYCLSPH